MVTKIDNKDVINYVCGKCGLQFEEQEWADKCEAWCSAHVGSCNLDIIQHAIDITDKGCC